MFDPLQGFLLPTMKGVDLGAGTGFTTQSFLKYFPQNKISLVDPDENLLSIARENLENYAQVETIIEGRGESLPFPEQSVDFILIGSAWHWMNNLQTLQEFTRILRPHSFVYIFEYQFPKGVPLHSHLNEWIRRKFNLEWKAPNQVPRGSLKEITENLRRGPQFQEILSTKFFDSVHWTSEFLAGFIFSQSRFQHYFESLNEAAQAQVKLEVKSKLAELFEGKPEQEFQFTYEGYLFGFKP